jgi:hypothetical protein
LSRDGDNRVAGILRFQEERRTHGSDQGAAA